MAASKLFSSFAELAKPERTLANVITALAGFLLACQWHVDFRLLVATLAGTSLVIGSASVLNNYFDRAIDKQMPRTQKRVLATDKISTSAVLIYAVILGIIGISILALFVNSLVVVLGIIAYLDYVGLYGYLKRRSEYAALAGTIAGSMSIVAGYCAFNGRLDAAAIILFLIMFFWQMPHFYAIAIYRLDDYKAANIPVWPAVRGIANTKRQIFIYTIGFLIACLALAVFGYEGIIYSVAAAIMGLAWLQSAAKGFKVKNSKTWARQFFSLSLIVNLALMVAIPVGVLLV